MTSSYRYALTVWIIMKRIEELTTQEQKKDCAKVGIATAFKL
jgi:hypothetical protein